MARESVSATSIAVTPRTTVVIFPYIASLLSLGTIFGIFPNTSRTTADEARINSESTVDMIAANTTIITIPVITGGNKTSLIRGSTVSASARSGNKTRPAIPIMTAPKPNNNIVITDKMPARATSSSLRIDI